MDYSYEWTLPDGKTSNAQQVRVQDHGAGTYKVKITATRQNSTEGGWLEQIGYGTSYISEEKTITVSPIDYENEVKWSKTEVNAMDELIVSIYLNYCTAGVFKLYDGTGNLILDKKVSPSYNGRTNFTVVDPVKSTHAGTYTWTFTPDSNLFVTKQGSLDLTVNKISPNPTVSVTKEIPLDAYNGTITMKADVPGKFQISSKNAAGMVTVFEEKEYAYTDTEISIDYKELITGTPEVDDYKLYYKFIPENTSDYISPNEGTVDYSIKAQSILEPVQATGGVVFVKDISSGSVYSNVGEPVTISAIALNLDF